MVFDHVKHKLKVIATIPVENQEFAEVYQQSVELIQRIIETIESNDIPKSQKKLVDNEKVQVKSNLTKEEYMANVEKAKEYIKAGDIFQVVLSQRFQVPLTTQPFDIYRSLRTINPAPYLYYLQFGEQTIIGSSPEMLVRVEDEAVQTMPIAGTRPRGKNREEDLLLEADLLADTKETAEHLMLVDLGRNDLGRVCQFGSVKVHSFMEVQRYSHVMHIVSNVRGTLGKDKTAFDALASCFPAGTVSGAPKIRAMEIIEELEPQRRGVYAGAIGYFGFTGNMDTCITIRTLLINNGNVYIQTGAGIVADSDPEKEYEETKNKARALLKTLNIEEE
jgi:anthranilate synthase component I